MLLTLHDIYDAYDFMASGGGSFDQFEFPRIDAGFLLKLSLVAFRNNGNNFTRWIAGLKRGSKLESLVQEETCLKAIWYTKDSTLLVPAGCIFFVRFYGCTAGDELGVHLQGYKYFLGD